MTGANCYIMQEVKKNGKHMLAIALVGLVADIVTIISVIKRPVLIAGLFYCSSAFTSL